MATVLIIEDNPELANLMAAAAAGRGHVPLVAMSGAAGLALLTQQIPQVAVVDLLLPDMGGGDVLRRLRDRGVPAFAMSGVYKGSLFSREAVETYGAIAFLEKPFSLDALFGTIETMFGVPQRPLPQQPPPLGRVMDAHEPPPDRAGELPPLEDWERAWDQIFHAPPESASPPQALTLPRAGNLSETSAPRLLTACWQAKLNGDLHLTQEQSMAIKVITFEGGQPVYAVSNLSHERFARFCARKGILSAEALERVARKAHDERLKTGDAMVQLGLINLNQRRALLMEQICEIIWSTFEWTEGRYAFREGPLRPDAVRLSVFPGTLIVDGFVRQPLEALTARLPGDRLLTPSSEAAWALEEFELTGEQARLIALCDGTKTVEDLVSLSDMDPREALGLLAGLEQLGIVAVRKDDPPSGRRVSFGL